MLAKEASKIVINIQNPLITKYMKIHFGFANVKEANKFKDAIVDEFGAYLMNKKGLSDKAIQKLSREKMEKLFVEFMQKSGIG